jgi:hypothetical protein
MALQYPQQSFYHYGQPHWPGDVKPSLTEDDSSSTLDDSLLDSSTPADMTPADCSDSRRASMAKMEDDISVHTNFWHERPQSVLPPARHYSTSSVPLASPDSQYFGPMSSMYGHAAVANQPWAQSARSEASTPTPFFGSAQESFGQQVHYHGVPVDFSGYPSHDPVSAISMSPQSSHGGWASTTSSDGTEIGGRLKHRLRGVSPRLVVRSDGIRKKNAKFMIPNDRNLSTIDDLIAKSNNDEEKKELKQQKRLLRNRQAA